MSFWLGPSRRFEVTDNEGRVIVTTEIDDGTVVCWDKGLGSRWHRYIARVVTLTCIHCFYLSEQFTTLRLLKPNHERHVPLDNASKSHL